MKSKLEYQKNTQELCVFFTYKKKFSNNKNNRKNQFCVLKINNIKIIQTIKKNNNLKYIIVYALKSIKK